MKNLKVLHIIDHTGPGGAQVLLKKIIQGKGQYLFSLRNKKKNIISGQNVFISKSFSNFSFYFFLELLRKIKVINPQILHFHLQKSLIVLFLLSLFIPQLIKNKKIIFHEHGNIFEDKNWYKWLLKFLQKKINIFIVPSNKTKELLLELKINDKDIKILPNFIEDGIVPVKERMKKGLFQVGFLGRLSYEKGCDILLNAIENLDIPFHLFVGGEGKQKEFLKLFAEKNNISNKITFLGYITDKKKFFEKLDCLVIPSRYESFGLSAIEAQSYGIAIVASNKTGMSSVLTQDNCLFFERGNSSDLEKKITYIYANSDRQKRLIEKGLENSKKYRFNSFKRALKNIYY